MYIVVWKEVLLHVYSGIGKRYLYMYIVVWKEVLVLVYSGIVKRYYYMYIVVLERGTSTCI